MHTPTTTPPHGSLRWHVLFACTAIVLNAQQPPAATGDTLELTPFTVETSRDRGYASTNTLSGTRTNEELRNLPNAISILNQQFIQDFAVNDFFEAMQYMVNMQAQEGGTSGQGGNSGVGVVVRGINNNWQSRNGFQWYVPADTFNTERLEANLGASGQLYGDIGAGGILNVGTKTAHFLNRNSVQVRLDDWGQQRVSLDLNRKVSDSWAVRVNAVDSRGGDWRDGPHNDIVAAALANSFKLGRKTNLRIDGEWGEINNRTGHNLAIDEYSDYVVVSPGTTGPDVDPITAGNQAQYSITAPNALGIPTSFATSSTIQAAGNGQGWRLIGGQLVSLETTTGTFNGTSTAGRTYRQTTMDATRRRNVSETLIPRDQQWWGPDATADRDYHTITAVLTHRISDKFWVELAYNLQDQVNTSWSTGTPAVRRDINPQLPAAGFQSTGTGVPNPVANPNFNELYIENTWDGSRVTNLVNNYRLVGVYDWDLPWNIRQRIVAMAALRDEEFTAKGMIETLSAARIASLGLTGAAAQYGNNRVTRRHYLRDGNSDASLARTSLNDVEVRAVSSAFNAQQFQSLTTGAINAFGSYMDGRIRSSVGIRRDLWEKDIIPVSSDPVTGEVVYNQPRRFDQRLWNTAVNYGAVINITPWLAAVANYSETFVANNAGRLFDGSSIPPQKGEGSDYGIRLNLFNDRLFARATYFDVSSRDAFVNAIVVGNTTNANTVLYEIVNILGATNSETGNPFTGTGANGRDLQDRNADGFEFELVANPLPNWTVRGVLTITRASNQNRARQLNRVFERMVERVDAGATGTLSNTPLTSASYVNTALRLAELADEDPAEIWAPQINTRYTFNSGRAKGFFIGGAAIWYDEQEIADTFSVATPSSPSVLTRAGYDIDSYTVVNAFLGYSRRFGKVQWQAQLNINNLLDEQVRLGGYTNGRYNAPRQLVLTNTFSF
jgi:outer membrane receptor protein involved in Fe transport